MYKIKFSRSAIGDVRVLDARWRVRVLDEVDRHLREHPATPSRARKLIDLAPPAELEGALQPFWQLRVEHYRVFYNVFETEREVRIWGIRAKPPEQTTSDVLGGRGETHEDDESV